jgi:hypothetical protein
VEDSSVWVYALHGGDAPTVLAAVGRARERTYREAGEGTGQARDLDRWDQHHLQLVVWDPAAGEVVGGYRLGFVREILGHSGPDGLSTTTTFEPGPALLALLGNAVELGRSFVVPEAQRSFGPLLGLWRGIGRVLRGRPGHHLLVGAVSIPAVYDDTSRAQIAGFLLSGTRRHPAAGAGVQARHPFPIVESPDDYAGLDRAVEARCGRRPPVLVRQYLGLGMRGVACGIDPGFGGCLDVLCMADLRDAPRALLDRYMGASEAGAWLAREGEARTG